jgi:fructoselysine-6-P-deglycase FrlB-like protein
LPDPARGLLYMPWLQLFAHDLAQARGLNPDLPPHLEQVVRLQALS